MSLQVSVVLEKRLNSRGGILLWRLREKRAEDRIAEIVGQALPQNERQIRVLEVALAPRQHGRIEGDDQSFVSGTFRTPQHAGG
jgi:hypothetical protein